MGCPAARSCATGQQVHGDIGIAAQADLGAAAGHAPGHDVRDHVHAPVQQFARHV